MTVDPLWQLLSRGVEGLCAEDPALHQLLVDEFRRQSRVLTMVAASSIVDPSVLVCESMLPVNVTAEGYPKGRYHAGCSVIDDIEQLAIDRAKAAFGAQYANVQPHSATTANQLVMCSLLKPGDPILGMALEFGGHLTHGARPTLSGQYFDAASYGTTADGEIDYDAVQHLADVHQPRLIICGATAYPRVIDFARFRQIADRVGAYLLADISHVAGLVACGLHPNPVDHAHITTTCTHKQLYGPRGGLILIGRDHTGPSATPGRTLAEHVQSAVFPFFQGAPNLNQIGSKARALARVVQPEFRTLASRIIDDARALAAGLASRGYRVITGGTDNHLVVIDVLSAGLTGIVGERALEDCDIIVNKNRIPGDVKSPRICSGIRFGTNSLAMRGLTPNDMSLCAELVHRVLGNVHPKGELDYVLDADVASSVRANVADLCARHPIPSYPTLEPAFPPAVPAD